MLSTLLSQLQSYFSKYFVVGSLSPVLAFGFFNGAMAYLLFKPWRDWVESELFAKASVGRGAFLSASLVIGTVLSAYAFSALNTFLRRQLEGEWWDKVANLFTPSQRARRERMVKELQDAAMDLADLSYAPEWERKIREAQQLGRVEHLGVRFVVPRSDQVQGTLEKLSNQRAEYRLVDSGDLEQMVNEIVERSRSCDIDASPYLGRQHEKLLLVVDYAKNRARARHARLQNELNSNYGAQEVAPTRMGNVANTIQSYAIRRYHCNLEVVWSNLQRIVQKDDKAQAALQEAKTQLDFLIACCWLTLAWTAVWAFVLGIVEPSRAAFISVALGGPVIAYLWYRAAVEQYRSFADVAMTSLDSFRFDLLRDMKLRVPADVEDEHRVWENIDRLVTYGEDQNFRYEFPKQP